MAWCGWNDPVEGMGWEDMIQPSWCVGWLAALFCFFLYVWFMFFFYIVHLFFLLYLYSVFYFIILMIFILLFFWLFRKKMDVNKKNLILKREALNTMTSQATKLESRSFVSQTNALTVRTHKRLPLTTPHPLFMLPSILNHYHPDKQQPNIPLSTTNLYTMLCLIFRLH